MINYQRFLNFLSMLIICGACCAVAVQAEEQLPLTVTMPTLDGTAVKLSERYKDRVVLVVNVASKCGLTPQYKDLQALYEEKKDSGFSIAAFPCNQFGKQEPGTAAEIQTFCTENYGVTFDVFAKVEVNGKDACDLYKTLCSAETQPARSGKISWNFEKFLIGRDGKLIARFDPRTKPSDAKITEAIEKALSGADAEEAVKTPRHLFILSGQSNMAGLNAAKLFTPLVEKEFGSDRVIVVHDAQSGQPIRFWYKQWKPEVGEHTDPTGALYDRMMAKVQAAIAGKNIQTVTFIWMQGEKDARERHGAVYAASLQGLLDQLSADLKRTDIHAVIGRLSDYDMDNKKYQHWTLVREQQAAFVKAYPQAALIDTDDLNDGTNKKGDPISNDLHYSVDGYVQLGQRFAEAAIALIKKSETP